MTQKKMESLQFLEYPCQIDSLSILSKYPNKKSSQESYRDVLTESDKIYRHQNTDKNIVQQEMQTQSLELMGNNNNQVDMSFLVVQGLQIARRQSKRQSQLNLIIPKYRQNNLILKEQLNELLFQIKFKILQQQQTQIKQKIIQLSNYIDKHKNLQSKPAPKVIINTRKYVSPKSPSNKINYPSKIQQRKSQQLINQIRQKKQQFMKNKIKLEQLAWQKDKLQRRSRIQTNNKSQINTIKTVSKKKQVRNDSEKKISFRRIRPSQSSKKFANNFQHNQNSNPYMQNHCKINKRYQLGKKKQNDKSDINKSGSLWTQQQTKKQALLRRLKILKESITLYEGTFSKIIAQIQMECTLLSKQIQCFQDQLSIHTYYIDKSDISKKNNIQNLTTAASNIQQTGRQKHSKSISPSPSIHRSRLSKCNSQNLKKLAQSKERKLSSYLINKSQKSLMTYKKMRIKSAHDEDSKQQDDQITYKLESPQPLNKSSEKKQQLILEEYFEKQNKALAKRHQNGLKTRYSPKIASKYF